MSTLPATLPAAVTINHGDHIVISAPGGEIRRGTECGFYAADTRLLSRYRLAIDGTAPTVLRDEQLRFYAARHELRWTGPPSPGQAATRRLLELTLERVADGGVHEDYEIRNATDEGVALTFEIAIEADFADMFEVRGMPLPSSRPAARTSWHPAEGELRFDYRSDGFERGLVIRCRPTPGGGGSAAAAVWADNALRVPLDIGPAASARICIDWLPQVVGRAARIPACGASTGLIPEIDGLPVDAPRIETTYAPLRRAWDQASWDLESLRLPMSEEPSHGEEPGVQRPSWSSAGVVIPGAGIPWFMTLFGRDSLITSMQAVAAAPELGAGTLARLALQQAAGDDPERDMEPGKILHEIRHGEVADRALLPFHPYYGTHDASALFVLLLVHLFHWTGDRRLLERFVPAAEAAVGWIERYGDRDGDGFQEYATRSPRGFYNQGWKDAHDAVPHADGSVAPLPIALCEHQALAYDARLRLAEAYDVLDREADAARQRAEARRLYERFNDAFWWEEEGTYYLGLDGEKRPIRSVASNAGQCLASGIVPPDRARRVAARIFAPDMWSGWGIRTLSADHPAYDPVSYHTGSVWPHDNAAIATGLAAAGLRAEVATIARGLIDVSAGRADGRLPELLSGAAREPGMGPVPYPGANVPQAWAATSVMQLVLLLLGLRARTDPGGQSCLYLDPALPAWLPAVTVRGIRAGHGRLSIRADGDGGAVLDNSTGFRIVPGPAPRPAA